ncbi:MAG: hypothetical protein Phog2KO_04600 [Phototrophicaceae bacterium]
MLAKRWARNFKVNQEDIDYLMNLLLEEETPMTTRQLARVIVDTRLEAEQAAIEEQYKNTKVYNPSEKYEVGDRVVFTEMELATATVAEVRKGVNPDYGKFAVIGVEFDDSTNNLPDKYREFAAMLDTEHKLSQIAEENPLSTQTSIDPNELLEVEDNHVMRVVHEQLRENDSLKRVAGYWFPEELVMETDIGVLHLSEAVLDMAGGGPLNTEEMLNQIGGIGDAPMKLQVFSLNLALNDDARFDEVGPAGEVLWYLNRMEPDAVRDVPQILDYSAIEYDDDLLSDEMFDLETELDDEYTEIEFEGRLPRATTTIIYPHRRAGTLPLSAKNQAIFPVGRAPRIHVELIDKEDGEKFDGWVVHEHRYVYGLMDYYTKHHLPVGVYLTVENGEEEGQIIISHEGYKPRTEYIRILSPNGKQILFENKKRQIGAEYDDLVIIGVDDLEGVDKLTKINNSKPLASIIREMLQALSVLSPQKTVHATTLYSAVNVMRRSAPGPIFATLSANPDFEDVGDHYWKLNSK